MKVKVFNMSYPYLIQGNNITVVIGNQPHTISKTHLTYEKVKDAIKAGDWETVKDIIEPKKVILNYGSGNVSVQGEQLFWKGKEFHSALASRMIAMLQEGFTIEPMVEFMENLMSNPSRQAVTELYGFLEKNNLPITPDGCFLAYKKVRDNYFDVHSGTMDNSVGNIVSMERNEVDDNRDNTCSAGLHFCSENYLKSFGGDRVVIVKINPRDVVSIPSDYNDAKGRTCMYKVIGEVGSSAEDTTAAFSQTVQSNATNNTYVAPVTNTPKLGSSAFYRGYTDGYCDSSFNGDSVTYQEGFYKGRDDAESGDTERYRYSSYPTQSAPTNNGFVGGANWPFPNNMV
jgi:hypothetical protein